MKICIVSQVFHPQEEGGAEISTRYAAEKLSINHEVVVLSLGMVADNVAHPGEQLNESSYRIHRINFRNLYLPSQKKSSRSKLVKSLWHIKNTIGAISKFELRTFLESEGFDLIYSHNCSKLLPALYEVAEELSIPICQHLRDYGIICPKSSLFYRGRNVRRPPLLSRVLTRRSLASSGSVKSVVSVSNFVRDAYIHNGAFPNSRFHVLYNTNTPRSSFSEELLSKREKHEGEFIFGYLGAISSEKGVSILIDAFISMKSKAPCRLIIGGRGNSNYMKYLIEKTGGSDNIEWLGHVNPSDVYKRAHVMIMPSLWNEPQGRILIEAATYGIPVLGAEVGGIPEFLEANKTGWTYRPHDTTQLANLMQYAADMGLASWYQKVNELFPGLQHYDGSSEATQYYEKLESILYEAAI